MISGKLPFYHENKKEMIKLVSSSNPPEINFEISDDIKSIIN